MFFKDLYSRLISEKIEPTDIEQSFCLSFYYYFPNVAEYNLTIKLAEYNKDELIIWSLSDNQPGFNYAEWNLGQISYQTTDTYRIYIEGHVGSSPQFFVGKQAK